MAGKELGEDYGTWWSEEGEPNYIKMILSSNE
jgi:hypothetical protein